MNKYNPIKRNGKIKRINLSKRIRKEIYCRDNGVCKICNKPVKFNNWNIDHVVAVKDGGSNLKINLRLTHITCNLNRRDYPKVNKKNDQQ